MKLSLERKFGTLHVRPGRLLTVAHDHQVLTSTVTIAEGEQHVRKFAPDEKWVTAEEGDLAVEVVAVKTGKVIAYSYIAGEATQLMLYTQPQNHWFTPAACVRADLSKMDLSLEPAQIMAGIIAMKYAPVDVVVFEAETETREDIQALMKIFERGYCMVPDELTDEQASQLHCTHLVGWIGTGKKKGPSGGVHFQPPKHSADYCTTQFQSRLLVRGDWPIFHPPWGAAKAAG